MKRNDVFLVLALILAAVAVLFGFRIFGKAGRTVTISENNKTVYEGRISTDKTVKLSHNTVVIKDGMAYMESADCRNQICVRHSAISKQGDTIICLPNKVLVEIK